MKAPIVHKWTATMLGKQNNGETRDYRVRMDGKTEWRRPDGTWSPDGCTSSPASRELARMAFENYDGLRPEQCGGVTLDDRWLDGWVTVVENCSRDEKGRRLIARFISESEQAKHLLRESGYGVIGTGILETVRESLKESSDTETSASPTDTTTPNL